MKNEYVQYKLFLFDTVNKIKNKVYEAPYTINAIHYFKKLIQQDIWDKMPKIVDNSLMHCAGFSFFYEMGLSYILPNELKYMMTGVVFLISAYHQYEKTKEDTNEEAETVIQKANEVILVSEEIFSRDAALLKRGGYEFSNDVHAVTIYTSAAQYETRDEIHDEKPMDSYLNTIVDVAVKTCNIISSPIFYLPFPSLLKDAILFFSSLMATLSTFENEVLSSQQIKKRNLLRDKMMMIKNYVYELQKKFGTEEEINKQLRLAEWTIHHAISIEPLDHVYEWKTSPFVEWFEWTSMQYISSLLKGGAVGSGLLTLSHIFLKNALPLRYFIFCVYALKSAYDFYQEEASHIQFRHELTDFYSELIDMQNKKLLPAKAIISAQTEFLSLNRMRNEDSIPSVKERGTMFFCKVHEKESMHEPRRRVGCGSNV